MNVLEKLRWRRRPTSREVAKQRLQLRGKISPELRQSLEDEVTTVLSREDEEKGRSVSLLVVLGVVLPLVILAGAMWWPFLPRGGPTSAIPTAVAVATLTPTPGPSPSLVSVTPRPLATMPAQRPASADTAMLRPTSTPIPERPLLRAVLRELETTYIYDPKGNVQSRTDANGHTITYDYDALSRLTKITYPDGSAVTYTYDQRGRRTEMNDSLGTTYYKYDDYDRLIQVTDANGNQVGYEYDLSDNLTALVYPNGQRVSYRYDEYGHLVEVSDSSGTTAYHYNEADQLVGRTLPNGVATTYDYNDAGRLIAITHTNPSGQVLLAFAYTLDAVGNSLQTVHTTANGQKLTTTYAYDHLCRLTGVTSPDGRTVQYRYDDVGNRLSMTTPEGETTYTYDEVNRLLQITGPSGVTTFAYDANGNLIKRRSPDKTTRYTYDYENRLVHVEDGTTVVEFVYDGDGNRVAKIVDGVRTEYVNHVNGLLPQVLLERSAGEEVCYVGGDRLFAQLNAATGEAFYLLEDRLGSTMALADRDGMLAATFHYDLFGAVKPVGSVNSPYGFAGERYDSETGLLYLHARYYDPGIGRFISKDPFPDFIRNPQSQNRYARHLEIDQEGVEITSTADRDKANW